MLHRMLLCLLCPDLESRDTAMAGSQPHIQPQRQDCRVSQRMCHTDAHRQVQSKCSCHPCGTHTHTVRQVLPGCSHEAQLSLHLLQLRLLSSHAGVQFSLGGMCSCNFVTAGTGLHLQATDLGLQILPAVKAPVLCILTESHQARG